MPNFFIDRPIFAWVIAIIIMLAGGLAILKLPVAQYRRLRKRHHPPESIVRTNSNSLLASFHLFITAF